MSALTKIISSLTNPEIKYIVKLHNATARDEFKQFIAEGFRTIETISFKFPIVKLFVTEDNYVQANKIFTTSIVTISQSVMNKISTATTPSGVLAIFNIPKQIGKIDDSAVVLAQISDPGNMGTLIRTAAACDIKTVVIIEGTDPWGPKVVQSSAGTITQVNILETSWQNLIKIKHDLKLCALVVSGGQNPKVIDASKSILVVGNEAHGLPDLWLKDCEQKMTLPMPGGTESLNAAIAGSIAIYLTKVNEC